MYLLILGGRYGSIEPTTGKSYTHWEYDYAGQVGKPRFAVVISEETFRKKGQENFDFVETINYQKYIKFKEEVLTRMSKIFSEPKDIQLAKPGALAEITSLNSGLTGWVSGSVLIELEKLEDEVRALKQENEKLKYSVKSNMANPSVSNGWQLKGKYLKFLANLYKVIEANQHTSVNMEELGHTLNFSISETNRIVDVLSAKAYISIVDISGGIAITIDGILMMEALEEPINKLDKLDKFLLRRIHNSLGESIAIIDFRSEFPLLDGYSEIAYHIISLQQKGFVEFIRNPFTTGGRHNSKFNNNVLSIDFKSIQVTELGREAIELVDILDYD